MRTSLLVLVLLFLVGSALPSFPQERKKKKRTQHYAILFSPGPGWAKGSAIYEQPKIKEHADYYRKLAKEGKVLLQGPFLDDSGVLVVVETETRIEAMAIATGDPLVGSKVLGPTLRPLPAVTRPPTASSKPKASPTPPR